jgi:hypothetical protein
LEYMAAEFGKQIYFSSSLLDFTSSRHQASYFAPDTFHNLLVHVQLQTLFFLLSLLNAQTVTLRPGHSKYMY